MIKQELNDRSPLRILERSTHGGLGTGNLGVIAARRGVGKTACLVHIATDKLFQGKPVIHVSYSSRVDYIITWYEDIFREIAKKRQLEEAVEIHEELIRNRVIMNFKQEGANTEQILKSVEALITHARFPAETVIVDGFDFTRSCQDDLRMFQDFAQRLGLEVWFSASLRGDEPLFDAEGVPLLLKGCLGRVAVCVTLSFQDGFVRLNLVKDRDHSPTGELPLRLDPKTLLIAEET